MKAFIILFLAISACHCQQHCKSEDDIAKILDTPPAKQDLEYLVIATERQADILNQTLNGYKPDEYPRDPTRIQCSAAIIGNLFADIELHVDDEKWELSESTLREYDELEKSMSASTNSRMKRGLFGFFRKVVRGIQKIVRIVARVVQVVKQIVNLVRTVRSIIRDVRGTFRTFG